MEWGGSMGREMEKMSKGGHVGKDKGHQVTLGGGHPEAGYCGSFLKYIRI